MKNSFYLKLTFVILCPCGGDLQQLLSVCSSYGVQRALYAQSVQILYVQI